MNEQWEYFHEVQKTHSSLYPGVDKWEHHFESVRDKTTGEVVARFHDKRYAMMFASAPDMLDYLIIEARELWTQQRLDDIGADELRLAPPIALVESATGLPIEDVLK